MGARELSEGFFARWRGWQRCLGYKIAKERKDFLHQLNMADEEGRTYGRLRRDMDLFSAIAVVVGNCIGAGIFITPSIVYMNSGSVGVDLLIWVTAGVASLTHGLCNAELGTTMPSAGGPYDYMKVSFKSLGIMGDMICSLYAWCFLLAEPMGTTLHALTFTSYCLSVVYGSFTPPYVVTILVTVAVIELSAAVNTFSLKVSMKVQNYLFVVKLGVLFSIIITGIVWSFRTPFPFDRFSFKGDTTPGRALQALSVAMFTGAGSTPICCMAEEMSNPGRIIPRSLLGGLFLVISLHVLTNMAYFIVLDPQRLTSSEATAFTFARPTWGVAGEVLVPVIVCICTFGTMSAACLTGSRLLLATARNKHLPEMLSLITTSSSLPVVAIICRTCLAILFTLTGSVEFLAKGFVGVISFMNVLTMFAMLKWRGHVQDTSRTFRVPTVLIFINIGILSLLTVIPLLGGREVTEYLVTLCFCLLGMPAFGVFRALGRTNAAVFAFTCLQKLFLSVPCTPFNKIERGRS